MDRSVTTSAKRIRRIEDGSLSVKEDPDQPTRQFDLQKLMELYKVPGISVAVIDHFEIAWAKAHAVTELA